VQWLVNPSEEELRLAWGIEWEFYNHRQLLSTVSIELLSPVHPVTSYYRHTPTAGRQIDHYAQRHRDTHDVRKRSSRIIMTDIYNADPSVLYTSLVTIRITRLLYTLCLFAAPYIYNYAAYPAVLFLLNSYLFRLVQTSRPTLWHARGTVFHTSNP
jgi:hypothetical protein